jgi:hypothetical protein
MPTTSIAVNVVGVTTFSALDISAFAFDGFTALFHTEFKLAVAAASGMLVDHCTIDAITAGSIVVRCTFGLLCVNV